MGDLHNSNIICSQTTKVDRNADSIHSLANISHSQTNECVAKYENGPDTKLLIANGSHHTNKQSKNSPLHPEDNSMTVESLKLTDKIKTTLCNETNFQREPVVAADNVAIETKRMKKKLESEQLHAKDQLIIAENDLKENKEQKTTGSNTVHLRQACMENYEIVSSSSNDNNPLVNANHFPRIKTQVRGSCSDCHRLFTSCHSKQLSKNLGRSSVSLVYLDGSENCFQYFPCSSNPKSPPYHEGENLSVCQSSGSTTVSVSTTSVSNKPEVFNVKSFKAAFESAEQRQKLATALLHNCNPITVETTCKSSQSTRRKPSATIQVLQEQLKREMENDKNKGMKKVEQLQQRQTACRSGKMDIRQWESPPADCSTRKSLKKLTRQRSKSRSASICKRPQKFPSPSKKERPYRQWLRMSNCVASDSKFIISSKPSCHKINSDVRDTKSALQDRQEVTSVTENSIAVDTDYFESNNCNDKGNQNQKNPKGYPNLKDVETERQLDSPDSFDLEFGSLYGQDFGSFSEIISHINDSHVNRREDTYPLKDETEKSTGLSDAMISSSDDVIYIGSKSNTCGDLDEKQCDKADNVRDISDSNEMSNCSNSVDVRRSDDQDDVKERSKSPFSEQYSSMCSEVSKLQKIKSPLRLPFVKSSPDMKIRHGSKFQISFNAFDKANENKSPSKDIRESDEISPLKVNPLGSISETSEITGPHSPELERKGRTTCRIKQATAPNKGPILRTATRTRPFKGSSPFSTAGYNNSSGADSAKPIVHNIKPTERSISRASSKHRTRNFSRHASGLRCRSRSRRKHKGDIRALSRDLQNMSLQLNLDVAGYNDAIGAESCISGTLNQLHNTKISSEAVASHSSAARKTRTHDVANKLLQKMHQSKRHHKYIDVKAIVGFEGSLPGQLKFRKGQLIKLLSTHRDSSDGMSYGYYRVGRLRKKKKGIFPTSCVTYDIADRTKTRGTGEEKSNSSAV